MTNHIDRSGDGTRPTTDGGVDNIGAAGSFTPGKTPAGEGPAPPEKMKDIRQKDKESVKQDDSAPLGLTPSAETKSNIER